MNINHPRNIISLNTKIIELFRNRIFHSDLNTKSVTFIICASLQELFFSIKLNNSFSQTIRLDSKLPSIRSFLRVLSNLFSIQFDYYPIENHRKITILVVSLHKPNINLSPLLLAYSKLYSTLTKINKRTKLVLT